MGKHIWRILLSASALVIAVHVAYFITKYSSLSVSETSETEIFLIKFGSLNPFFVHSHFLGGSLALITACIQLWLKPGNNAHRLTGYAYVISVSIGAVGGFYLVIYSHLGWRTGVSFLILDALWVFSTFSGIYSALKGNRENHRRWMMRSLAFTFAAISLRLQLPPLLIVVDIDTAYLIVAWSSWIINLILIEIYLFYKTPMKSTLAAR